MNIRVLIISVIMTTSTLFFPSCSSGKSEVKSENSPMQKKLQEVMEKPAVKKADSTAQQHSVGAINGLEELNALVEKSPGKLLVFDLYADWCRPCKMLAPLYDSLSRDHSEKASFFRVDVQRHQDVAYAFKVQSIPLIVFIRDKEIVHAVTGINTRDYYERIITNCSAAGSAEECKEKLKEIL